MVVFVKQWVINIVALVLFIVMFEMLLPTGRMKKVVNLTTGAILIIAIISPLIGIFGKGVDFDALQISNGNYLDRLQIEKDGKLLEKERMEQIVAVYREKIIEQLEQNAREIEGIEEASADVILNEDYNSGTFGEIKRAYIEIVAGRSDSGNEGDEPVKPVSKVRKVRIGGETNELEIMEDCDPALKKKLEEKISGVFGVSGDNIVISQVKR